MTGPLQMRLVIPVAAYTRGVMTALKPLLSDHDMDILRDPAGNDLTIHGPKLPNAALVDQIMQLAFEKGSPNIRCALTNHEKDKRLQPVPMPATQKTPDLERVIDETPLQFMTNRLRIQADILETVDLPMPRDSEIETKYLNDARRMGFAAKDYAALVKEAQTPIDKLLKETYLTAFQKKSETRSDLELQYQKLHDSVVAIKSSGLDDTLVRRSTKPLVIRQEKIKKKIETMAAESTKHDAQVKEFIRQITAYEDERNRPDNAKATKERLGGALLIYITASNAQIRAYLPLRGNNDSPIINDLRASMECAGNGQTPVVEEGTYKGLLTLNYRMEQAPYASSQKLVDMIVEAARLSALGESLRSIGVPVNCHIDDSRILDDQSCEHVTATSKKECGNLKHPGHRGTKYNKQKEQLLEVITQHPGIHPSEILTCAPDLDKKVMTYLLHRMHKEGAIYMKGSARGTKYSIHSD